MAMPIFEPIGSGPQSFRIGIVDDNPIVQRILVKILEKNLGVTVPKEDLFSDGLSVLDALGKRRFDLILLDIDLPILDGYETVLRIRGGGSLSSRTQNLSPVQGTGKGKTTFKDEAKLESMSADVPPTNPIIDGSPRLPNSTRRPSAPHPSSLMPRTRSGSRDEDTLTSLSQQVKQRNPRTLVSTPMDAAPLKPIRKNIPPIAKDEDSLLATRTNQQAKTKAGSKAAEAIRRAIASGVDEDVDLDISGDEGELDDAPGPTLEEQIRDLSSRIRTSNRSIPIICITANTLYEQRLKYMQGGMDEVLTKPFNPNTITSVISRFMEQVRPSTPKIVRARRPSITTALLELIDQHDPDSPTRLHAAEKYIDAEHVDNMYKARVAGPNCPQIMSNVPRPPPSGLPPLKVSHESGQYGSPESVRQRKGSLGACLGEGTPQMQHPRRDSTRKRAMSLVHAKHDGKLYSG
ncbi:uncharacterized protein SPPG_06366 [Spizellomyces punctatus DAOM BR117]|uniref:Response regulatory domain-containing protein n=1 Tax=Spizellomyces punctatus (strain DAOM BR117) TaxID=645134 RepID=A0A0L0HCQ7_SPIPD|nr:uncharacterized protein SPPG_06366 [Spizellomyces punctatus DAOM BR117]KNC98684.1 hypothetical protein SPPG_06366 [Spizellomyces punctatus DAOM BR117]|eukprot:XP_016606724.1 hypothetical protein SPPG_06366 [Spizellomyces punctatus DAOM BR117]